MTVKASTASGFGSGAAAGTALVGRATPCSEYRNWARFSASPRWERIRREALPCLREAGPAASPSLGVPLALGHQHARGDVPSSRNLAGPRSWRLHHGRNRPRRDPTLVDLHFLRGYAPELNPAEVLNQDLKTNALGRRRPLDLAELKADVRRFLRSAQRRPARVARYFRERHVSYAAAPTI